MDDRITSEALMARYSMQKHVENGAFVEKHYDYAGEGRAPSGSIYYYVAPDELTEFHVIDCDEYWCYINGSPLDVWLVDAEGVTVRHLGIADGCDPLVFVPRGTVFGSRHASPCEEGTFLSCITVPRFDPDGFRLIQKDEMLREHPAVKDFYR